MNMYYALLNESYIAVDPGTVLFQLEHSNILKKKVAFFVVDLNSYVHIIYIL